MVFRLRSVRSIVMAPARTGRERRRRIAVIKIDQIKRGIRVQVRGALRILMTVVIKLIAPKIEEAPAR